MVFHWSASESKYSQFSRTRLSIQIVLNDFVVWMISILPLISSSKSLGTYPSESTMFGITVTLMVHSFSCFFLFVFWEFFGFLFVCLFFSTPARFKYFYIISVSFIFTLWSAGTANSAGWQVLFFFSCWSTLCVTFCPELSDRLYHKNPDYFIRLII